MRPWSPPLPSLVTCSRTDDRRRLVPYDAVAQTKLVYGFVTGMIVYILCLLVTLPFLPFTVALYPLFFWLSLRWMEDLMSSLRASLALLRLLSLGKGQVLLLRGLREELRGRVVAMAVANGLPVDPSAWVQKTPRWRRALHLGFFSLRRRRKKGEFSRSSLSLQGWGLDPVGVQGGSHGWKGSNGMDSGGEDE